MDTGCFPFKREFSLENLINFLEDRCLIDEKTQKNIIQNFKDVKEVSQWTPDKKRKAVESLLPYLSIKNGPFAIMGPFSLDSFYSYPHFEEQFEDE